MRECAALLIAAPASGQGKTTVTAGLARRYRDQGKRVRVFKAGPDFIDPMLLEAASGHPVYQLDLWMGGEAHCRHLLYTAAAEADVILVEGVMGLFDGTTSSADLAMRCGLPVLAVIDASAMAQTFGAIAYGMMTYRPALPFAGVFANQVAGEAHYRMLEGSLREGVSCLGWMGRDLQQAIPERRLGLVQAAEIPDIDARIARTASAIRGMDEAFPPVIFDPPVSGETVQTVPALLKGCRIAVARDAAFGFLYQANLDVLAQLGATLCFFSPLHDISLPVADAVYLPGGYPELHLDRLAGNQGMKVALSDHLAAGKPLLAEGGGMLYLAEVLTDAAGNQAALLGLLPGKTTLSSRLVSLGLHEIVLPEGTLRGQAYHHAQFETSLTPLVYSVPQRDHGRAEPMYRQGRMTASCLHVYFPSNPVASARLFLP